MAMFNFQQLSTQMRHLARKLQETEDPITKRNLKFELLLAAILNERHFEVCATYNFF